MIDLMELMMLRSPMDDLQCGIDTAAHSTPGVPSRRLDDWRLKVEGVAQAASGWAIGAARRKASSSRQAASIAEIRGQRVSSTSKRRALST